MKSVNLNILKVLMIFLFSFLFINIDEVGAREIYVYTGTYQHNYDPADYGGTVSSGKPYLGELSYRDWGSTWGTSGDGVNAHLFLIHYPGNIVQDAFCVEKGIHTDENYITDSSKIYYGGPACILKANNIETKQQTTVWTSDSPTKAAKLLSPSEYARIQNLIWDALPNNRITDAYLHTDPSKVEDSCKTVTCTNVTGSISLSSSSNKLRLDGSSYRTDDITVNRSAVGSYKITLTGSGAKVYDASNNREITGSTSASKIYIRVSAGGAKEVTLKVEGSYTNTCTTVVPTFQLYSGSVNTDRQRTIIFAGSKSIQSSSERSVNSSKSFILDIGNIIVDKIDKVSGNKIKGAKFQLYDSSKTNKARYADGTEVPVKTTDANGKITYTNLNFGTYYLKEVETLEGYKISNNFVEASLNEASVSITVKNEPLGKLTVKKVDAITSQVLKGAKFQLLDDKKNPAKDAYGNAIGVKTTDENGLITYTNLKFGTYYLKEEGALEGYKVRTDAISKSVSDFNNSITVTNEPIGKLTVKKVDSITGKVLKGAKFQLLDDKKNPAKDVYGNAIGVKTTDENGLITYTNLKLGTYYLKEEGALKGYKVRTDAISKSVSDFNNSITVSNTPLGKLTVKKIDEETNNVLKGATFQLLDANMKPAVDGYGNAIEAKTTDENGLLTYENLLFGTYYLNEIKNPEGYKVIVTPVETKIKDFTNEATVKNTPIIVEVIKRDLFNKKINLSGATIVVKDVNTNKVFNEFITTDELMRLRFVPGKYILQEVIAPDGYLIYDENISIDINDKGDVKITSEADNFYKIEDGKIVIYNEPTKISISKQDIANSKELVGAQIIIYDYDGNVVQKFTSTEEPYMFYIKPGKYTLEETVAPKGYDKLKTNIEFEIDKNGNVKVLSTDSRYYEAESNRFIIYNVKEEVKVPDTGTFLSIGTVIAGVSILGYGLYIIKKQKMQMQ